MPHREKVVKGFQITTDGNVIWVTDRKGCTVARFSKTGIDVHYGFEEQLKRGVACVDCRGVQLSPAAWDDFVDSVKKHHGVQLPEMFRPDWCRVRKKTGNRRAKRTDAYVRGVGLKVAARRCDECLFSGNKIVTDARRDQLLTGLRKNDKYFICHKATARGDAAVCRGFYDKEPNRACVVARRLNLVAFVDPTTGERIDAQEKESEAEHVSLTRIRR